MPTNSSTAKKKSQYRIRKEKRERHEIEINGIHARRFQRIKSFVNFDINLVKPLTKYQKAKIKKYYDAVDALTARPFQVYRPRRKDHLKAAQAYSQQTNNLPGLKVAFVPTPGKKVKVKFSRRGEIVIESDNVKTRNIQFDIDKLLADPENHVKDKIKNREENSFTIRAGDHEISIGFTKATLPGYISNLTKQYTEGGEKFKGYNHAARWLNGVNAHEFKAQEDFFDYLREKGKAKDKLKRERKARRSREFRQKMKGR